MNKIFIWDINIVKVGELTSLSQKETIKLYELFLKIKNKSIQNNEFDLRFNIEECEYIINYLNTYNVDQVIMICKDEGKNLFESTRKERLYNNLYKLIDFLDNFFLDELCFERN